MPGTAFLQAAADALHLDGEAGVTQALLELAILPRRPDRQHAAFSERRPRRCNPAVIVQAGVVGCREGGGTVVDVEEHRVEAPPARAQGGSDVADFDPDAFVFQRLTGERPERAAVPLDDGRHELGDDDGRGGREHVEGRSQGEAHAETADEHARLVAQPGVPAAERRQRFFGAVHAARHQRLAAREDHVLAPLTGEAHVLAVRGAGLTEQLPGPHRLVTAWAARVQGRRRPWSRAS